MSLKAHNPAYNASAFLSTVHIQKIWTVVVFIKHLFSSASILFSYSTTMKKSNGKPDKPSFFSRLYDKAMAFYQYCTVGVWRSSKHSFSVILIKTAGLSVRSFLDRGLQNKSTSLTYNTVLAIVPALALVFAICRGFGFQNLLADTLRQYIPGQEKAVDTALSFVDSYLNQASQGIFVGIGLVMLLWTLISLLSNIEEAFNNIWDIKRDRTFFQKVTDYISLCLIVPILLICSSGLSIFMSTTLQDKLNLPFLTPVINILLELTPLIMVWLAFSLSYMLIPNTKVEFKCAAIAGGICAIMFQILQLLFVNGQIYVAKYNAIYGSFSFLPLLLIWLQMSWLILLFGCVLTYSLQNVFAFNYLGEVSDISRSYIRQITIAVTAIIVQRFNNDLPPMSRNEISTTYGIPVRLVGYICERLKRAGLLNFVLLKNDILGMTPAIETDKFTIGYVFRALDNKGDSNFIPNFSELYGPMIKATNSAIELFYDAGDDVKLTSLPLPTPAQISELRQQQNATADS